MAFLKSGGSRKERKNMEGVGKASASKGSSANEIGENVLGGGWEKVQGAAVGKNINGVGAKKFGWDLLRGLVGSASGRRSR